MEESGEQGTVVFALIVTEPASECVCGGGGRGSLKGEWIGWKGTQAILMKYPRQRSMKDDVYTPSHISTGLPFCGRLSPGGEGDMGVSLCVSRNLLTRNLTTFCLYLINIGNEGRS